MFLIISSSVYPAITSGTHNKEMAFIAEALAQEQDPNDRAIDTSDHHSSIPTSQSPTPTAAVATPTSITSNAAISDEGKKDFTIQAAIGSTVSQTNNIVNTLSYYDVIFKTTTAGAIKKIEVTFPVGTIVGGYATFIEAEGIGPGTTQRTDPNTVVYTVNNAVNIPAGQVIRLEFSRILNPPTPSDTYQLALTTRNAANGIVVGPTPSVAYKIKQIGTSDIANGAVTTPKIADGSVTSFKLADNAVTTPKLADKAVTFSKLSPDAIPTSSSFIAWQDDTTGNNEILFRRGVVFDPEEKNLSNNAGFSGEPSIAIAGNNVYVVWYDDTPGNNEILYKRSTDGGANFDPTINLSNDAGVSDFPAVTASGNNVYVVWRDNTSGNDEISYRRSTDGGANFDATINLSNNAGMSLFPAVTASGNNVYVVWQDTTLGNIEILYGRSTDGGANFDPTINLSNDAGFSLNPAVATSGNNAYVVWRDETSGNNEILYKRSTDGGANFDATINLSNNAEFSSGQVVTASGNNVYVVWSDSAPGTFEILYRRSTDGGANFDPTINLSNTGVGVSFSPAIAYYDTQL